jgi:hypothetical protein
MGVDPVAELDHLALDPVERRLGCGLPSGDLGVGRHRLAA